MKHLNKKMYLEEISEPTNAFTYPLKVVNNISRVTSTKVWYRYTDLFIVLVKVDADVLLKFLPPPQRSIH